ncbi:MAG: TIGR01459 family HAD-type hydrolase [bacterium]|nr:TIGR01459 family HAD-type hydrolase [bacterium]
MLQTAASIKKIPSLKKIVEGYDIFIFGLNGVLREDHLVCGQIREFLEHLCEHQKVNAVLGNTPTRSSELRDELKAIGILPSLYQNIMTSCEEAYQILKNKAEDPTLSNLGNHCLFIGDQKSRDAFSTLDLKLVDAPEEATFVLVTGTDPWRKNIQKYENDFKKCIAKGLPFLCANPSRFQVAKDIIHPAAGALADLYKSLGGTVHFFGKPNKSSFDRMINAMDPDRTQKVLMVGSSLEIDIKGAHEAGLDTLLVGSCHTPVENMEALLETCQRLKIFPTYVIPAMQL